MRKQLSLILSLLLASSMTTPLVGCGDDEPQVAAQRGAPRAAGGRGRPAAAKRKGAAAVGAEDEKLPPKLRNVDWKSGESLTRDTRDARDPFKPYVEDLVEKPVEEEPPKPGDQKIKVIAGRHSVPQLQLMAIITGTVVNKAMLVDPSGLGHVVRPGDVVGEDAMRVERITRNEILFKPLRPPTDDKEPAELRKVLLTQEELAELLP